MALGLALPGSVAAGAAAVEEEAGGSLVFGGDAGASSVLPRLLPGLRLLSTTAQHTLLRV